MLIKCRECGKEISTRAAACPHCGCPVWQPTEGTPPKMEPEQKKRGPIWLLLVLVGFLLFVAFSGLSSGSGAYRSSSGTRQKSYSEADYKSATYTLAEEQVKKHLKAPSTAKFCKMSEASFSKDESDTYVMTGWVDAENSYGATLRTNWGIKIKVSGDKITMQKLIIGSETVYP